MTDNVIRYLKCGGEGPMRGFGGAIPDAQDEALRAAVAEPHPPDVQHTIYADVLSHLELGNYRLAVIETAVLFEAFLTAIIREYLTYVGREREIEQWLFQPNGRPHEVEHIAKVVIRDVSGFQFKTTHEFRDWKERVAQLRNAVVHGRIFDVTKTQAEDALATAQQAMALIRKRLFPDGSGDNAQM